MVFFCGLVGVKSLGGAYTYWYCSDNFVYLLPEVRELIRDTKPRTSTTLGSTFRLRCAGEGPGLKGAPSEDHTTPPSSRSFILWLSLIHI